MKKLYIFGLCLFLSACLGGRSLPSRFYSIDTVPVSQKNVNFSDAVALTYVHLPKHLDRPQMVVFDSEKSQLVVSEKNRWVEPLPNLMERILAMDLADALPSAVVKQKTQSNERFDAFLSVDITELKAVWDDKITLNGWWVLRTSDGKIIKREKIAVSTPLADKYADIGKSLSKLLSSVAEKIAKRL